MLNLQIIKRVIVVGGGTAGWFAALEIRRCFPIQVEVLLIESEQIGIIGAGEGSIPNFERALERYGIDRKAFIQATGSNYKLGICFEGWRADSRTTYHHLFSTTRGAYNLLDWPQGGFYPMSSYLLAHNYPLDQYPDARALIDREASQQEVANFIVKNPKDVFAYHFDARKLASYLSEVACERGVRRVNAIVENVMCDEFGNVNAVVTDQGRFAGDFFIDASGFRSVIARKKLGIEWQSFDKYLILDSALPFLIPRSSDQPALTTLSKAMNNGWMWEIPTQDRKGCGYVFSSAHTDKDKALAELSAHFKTPIEPINHIRFRPGRLSQCLSKNVMAVGLAAGFVEPLEATSIAQTLFQLNFFGNLIENNAALLSGQMIQKFNQEVGFGWDGILDFLVMHYDTDRCDTPFWKDVQQAPKTDRYNDLKSVMQHRTPTGSDMACYCMDGIGIFGVASWETVGSSMGLIAPSIAQRQIERLSSDARAGLRQWFETFSMRPLGK